MYCQVAHGLQIGWTETSLLHLVSKDAAEDERDSMEVAAMDWRRVTACSRMVANCIIYVLAFSQSSAASLSGSKDDTVGCVYPVVNVYSTEMPLLLICVWQTFMNMQMVQICITEPSRLLDCLSQTLWPFPYFLYSWFFSF